MSKYLLQLLIKRRTFLKFVGALVLTSCENQQETSFINEKQSNSLEESLVLGNISEFTKSYTGVPLVRIAVLRNITSNGDSEFRALSLVCTHQNCIVRPDPDGTEYICPCHDSRFDKNGNAIKGPAEKPLSWKKLGIRDGQLLLFPEENVNQSWKLSVP